MNCRVQSYASRSTGLDELDDSLTKDLTEVEKHLMRTQDMMRVRGKVCTQRNVINFLWQRNMNIIYLKANFIVATLPQKINRYICCVFLLDELWNWFEYHFYTPHKDIRNVYCFWSVRQSVIHSVHQSSFSCQHNSSETAQQNFVKLCSTCNEGHNVQMCISTGNFLFNFFFSE